MFSIAMGLLSLVLWLQFSFLLIYPLLFFSAFNFFLIYQTHRQTFFFQIGLLGLLFFFLLDTFHLPSSSIPQQGEGTFCVEQIQHFQNKKTYRVHVHSFISSQGIKYGNFPASYHLKGKHSPLVIGGQYHFSATLTQKSTSFFQLQGQAPPSFIKKTFTLTPLRQKAKLRLKALIHPLPLSSEAREVFHTLITGDMHQSMLLFYFKQFGLIHLLAISGLHFGLIAMFLDFLLSFFLQDRYRNLCLALLLSGYFLFLGISASILRAFLMILLALSARFIHLKPSATNFWCFAMILSLCYYPFFIFSIGFQFSYLITLGILLGFSPLQKLLEPSCQHLFNFCFPRFSQVLATSLSSLIALNYAVLWVSLPLNFFHFNHFPLASFFYNLFFPFFFSFILFFLLAALLLYPLFSTLAETLIIFTAKYTDLLLNVLFLSPTIYQVSIWWEAPSPSLIIAWVLLSFFSFFYLSAHLETSRDPIKIWF